MATRYQVVQNGRPAQAPQFPVAPEWNKSIYDQLATAVAYANDWLGAAGPLPADYAVDTPFNFGTATPPDVLIIRSIPTPELGSPPFGIVEAEPRKPSALVAKSLPAVAPPVVR